MNDSAISVRYAKALFQTASDMGISKEVLLDMNALEVFFTTIPEFSVFIDSPIVKVSEKLSFFKKIGEPGFQELTRRFLDLIVKNKRESHILGMVRNFNRLYREELGIVEAHFTTANKAQESTLDQVKELIRKSFKSEVELTEEVKPEIIGGFVLRIEDQQLDASISAQLKKVQRELSNTLL
jgi:F-type H+-transporting ATPase subunit delta